MTLVSEFAPAKINLTLRVLGRRPDGYHEIESLVAFADIGDRLTLDTEASVGVETAGPFAGSIAGANLLAATLDRLARLHPQLRLGRVHLDKHLPVAAGIGGGSADVAALIRAVRKVNPDLEGGIDWGAFGLSIGADVPVCLASRAAWMGGIGERVVPLGGSLPPLVTVLVNPLQPAPADKTAQVFKMLAARPLAVSTAAVAPAASAALRSRESLLAHLRQVGNELAEAAALVVPATATVLETLRACEEVAHAAVSGGGPTCFGVVEGREAAHGVVQRIAAARPGWWVAAAVLR